MSDSLDFTGKVALVTGSSRGIGAEMIKAFGKHGAQCVVNYVADAQGRNKSDAENVARDLKKPVVIQCDVTQPGEVCQPTLRWLQSHTPAGNTACSRARCAVPSPA